MVLYFILGQFFMSLGQFGYSIITNLGIIINNLLIVFYILQAWGLYMISKKLGDKYSWLAWIPLIQLYTIIKTGGKSSGRILWFFICYIIIGLSFWFYALSSLNGFGSSIVAITILILVLVVTIIMLILNIKILHGISKRTGRGAWTTVGLLFIPFIMFPIVGYKLQRSLQN